MWLLKYSRVVKRIKEFILCGLDKLQKFQNHATESAVVLKTLGWETLKSRRQKMNLYKILNNYTAPNLKESLIGSSLTQANYNLRNSYTDLALPNLPKNSFKYSRTKLWNSLSREAKEA